MKSFTVVFAMLLVAALAVGCGEGESTPDGGGETPNVAGGGTPDVPDVPDQPDMPDVPDVPDMPDVPAVPDMPDEPHAGVALVEASCTSCHGIEKVEAVVKNRDGWSEQITNCLGMAAAALPADAKGKMLDYLVENFGE